MMNGRHAEPHNGAFRANLGDLSHVPAKEFELHFREWLERDDVARSLQAKLRADLILNFNKTALGKQLMSESASSLGGSTHRLTLSPLILALNTLVAEFLYAVNCHFSLSVFSTEVPFRNVLPDFESKRCFRFTEHEIVEIIEALSGNYKCERSVKYKLAQTYRNSGTTSLLLLLVKHLMQQVCLKPDGGGSPTRHSSSALSPRRHHRSQSARRGVSPPPSAVSSSTKTPPQDLKSEIYNTNFRYLNKYLIILCKKVKEMTDLLDHLGDKRARSSATSSSRKHSAAKSALSRGKSESMERSLETITKNLRELKASKRNDKQVGSLVAAIEALSGHFQQCAVNFDKLSRDFAGPSSKAVKECPPLEKCPAGGDVAEKPYSEWVREMRHSANGRRFLDRVEASMSKALNKQRLHLEEETEAKLKHQKHLLKVHYRQKLIQKIDKRTQNEDLALQENVEQQLKQFESKHLQLLCKMQEAELEAIRLAKTESNASKVMSVIREKILDDEFPSRGSRLAEPASQVEAAKVPVVPLIGDPVPVFSLKPVKVSSVIGKLTENTASQTEKLAMLGKDVLLPAENIQNIVKGIVEHDRHVEEIIAGAKKRINELENVGSQLDQNFQAYLDRQKKQKDVAHEAALKMCRNYANERQKLREHINKIKEVSTKQPLNPNGPLIVAQPQQQQTGEVPKQAVNTQAAAISSDSSPAPEPRNAIKEAKEKFLNERSLVAAGAGAGADPPRAPSPDGLEAHFINEKFTALPTLGGAGRKAERPVARPAQLSSGDSTKSTSSLSSSSSSNSLNSNSGNSSNLKGLGVDVNMSTPTSTTANTTSSPSSSRGIDAPAERRQLSSAGCAGNNGEMPEAANQNNSTSGINNVTISSGSSIAAARCDKNNFNGTEVSAEFCNNNNNNNTGTGERTNAGGMTKALPSPRTGGMQQIKDNKRASGNHDGSSSTMAAAPSPSTSSTSLMHQQSMMKMKRLFASVLQPASQQPPLAPESGGVFNNGVNDVEAVVVATTSTTPSPAGRDFIGAAAVGAATITVATVLTTPDGPQQRLAGGKQLERASASSSLAAGPHRVVNNDVALRQLQRHGNTERNTNMSLDNKAPASPPPEPDLELCKRQEAEVAAAEAAAAAIRPQGVQSINDSFVQSPEAAPRRSHSVKPMKMPDNNVADAREEEPGDEDDDEEDEVMFERGAEADDSSDVVSYEYTPDLSVNEDEDDKAGSSALQLKRTEAQTSLIHAQRQRQQPEQQQKQQQQQQQQGSKSNSSEIKTALDRLIAGNDEIEGPGKRRGVTRSAVRPGSGSGAKEAAERSSSSVSGSDFWK